MNILNFNKYLIIAKKVVWDRQHNTIYIVVMMLLRLQNYRIQSNHPKVYGKVYRLISRTVNKLNFH
jgi:hypothetical protein